MSVLPANPASISILQACIHTHHLHIPARHMSHLMFHHTPPRLGFAWPFLAAPYLAHPHVHPHTSTLARPLYSPQTLPPHIHSFSSSFSCNPTYSDPLIAQTLACASVLLPRPAEAAQPGVACKPSGPDAQSSTPQVGTTHAGTEISHRVSIAAVLSKAGTAHTACAESRRPAGTIWLT